MLICSGVTLGTIPHIPENLLHNAPAQLHHAAALHSVVRIMKSREPEHNLAQSYSHHLLLAQIVSRFMSERLRLAQLAAHQAHQ